MAYVPKKVLSDVNNNCLGESIIIVKKLYNDYHIMIFYRNDADSYTRYCQEKFRPITIRLLVDDDE